MAPSGAGAVPMFLLLILIATHAFGQRITESPNALTIFLNHKGKFTCDTINADYTYWNVNGTSTNRKDVEGFNVRLGANGSSTLTVLARAVYNGSTIQCVTGSNGVVKESRIVTLMIQGLLSSVVNLETDVNTCASSINVSWGAPFSLDVTGVDPDIWYSVLIYNGTDEENSTAVPCTDCHNLTQTHYTFSPDYPSPCHDYNFTVIPYNGAGQGESSQTTQIQPLNSPVVNKSAIRIVNGKYEIIVHFRDFVDMYNSTLHIEGRNETFHSSVGSQNTFEFEFHDKGKYNAYIELTFYCSRTVNTSYFDFKTFDIQYAQVDVMPEGIHVTVTFINGSFSKGSFIAVQCEKTESDHYRSMEIDKAMISVPHVDTAYTVFVYDLGQDGLPSTMPAVEVDEVHVKEALTDSMPPYSKFLKRAELSRRASGINITCEFADEYPEASCILVYKKYNDSYLTVKNYVHSTVFPVTISVEDSENYTFAVFGKSNNKTENGPVILLKKEERVTYPPPPQTSDKESGGDSSGVIFGTTLVCLTLIALVVIGIAIIWKTQMKKRPLMKQVHISNNNYDTVLHCNNPMVEQSQNVAIPLEEDQPIEDVSDELGDEVKVKEDPKYASIVTSSMGMQSPIKEDLTVQYQTIDHKATQRAAHPHGLLYAELVTPPPQHKLKIILDEPKTPYVTVVPQTTACSGALDDISKEREDIPMQELEKPQVEDLMKLLYCVAVRWKDIAEGLGFVEHHIDEIFTNNETDVACLQDVMEQWMRLGPTWEKLAQVLSDIGEDSLAQQAGVDKDKKLKDNQAAVDIAQHKMEKFQNAEKSEDEETAPNDELGMEVSPAIENEKTENKEAASRQYEVENSEGLEGDPPQQEMKEEEDENSKQKEAVSQHNSPDTEKEETAPHGEQGMEVSPEDEKSENKEVASPQQGIEKPQEYGITEEKEEKEDASQDWVENSPTKPVESIGEGPQKVVAEQQVLVVQETSTSGEEIGKVMMLAKTKQHGNVPQPTVDLQNEGSTEDYLPCSNCDENQNTGSELFSPVMCSDDEDVDDDKSTDALALIGGTTHPISGHSLTKSAQKSLGTYDSTQDETMEPVSCTEVSNDATFVISPSRSPLQMEDDEDKASDRKFISDGSVMIPQPCTEDLSADTEANEVQFSGVFFTCKPEKRCSGKIKFTDRSLPVPELSERPKLCPKELVIAPGSPFHPTGVVTGQMYRDPKQMDCYEIEAQYVNVGCPKISAGKTPEKPPLPQLPVIEPQPTEKQLPQAPEKNVVSTKLHQPFKKCQWSDPPDNYNPKLLKWTYNGIARGFHGPDDLFSFGRNSHYG